jgi:hypothetical protein
MARTEGSRSPFDPYIDPAFYGAYGRETDEKPYWGPKTLPGFNNFQPWNKPAALNKTIRDLRDWQREQYEDEIVAGVNMGPNSELVRRANTTQNRMTDYSKTAGRLANTDLRKERSAKYRAAQAARKKRNEGKK